MKNIITTVLIAVVVGGAAFFGGMKYSESQSLQTNILQGGQGRQGGQGGQGGSGRSGRGGNFINGEVMSKDDKSITIKLRNGGSQFIFFAPSTQILKAVSGTTNSDGSVTAQMIQIRPPMAPANQNPSLSQQAASA